MISSSVEPYGGGGGESLTVSFSFLLSHPTFKSTVGRRMTYEERLSLYALHEQAMHGDAPAANTATNATASSSHPNSSSPSSEDGTTTRTSSSSSAAATATGNTNSSGGGGGLRWLNFAAKARERRWAALRGAMSPQVARESFCAEFLAALDRHPSAEMAPLVEAALSRARASDNDNSNRGSSHQGPGGVGAAAAAAVFCVRSFKQDPAATALLWICRAHAIPCEVTAEPLVSAIRMRPKSRRGIDRKNSRGAAEADLFFLSGEVAHGQAPVPFYAGVRQGQRLVAEVSGPEAAFELLCDAFLARMPHWAGRRCCPSSFATSDSINSYSNSIGGSSRAAVAASVDVRRAAERAEWLEDLQRVTAHLRTPIMALLIQEAIQNIQKGGEKKEEKEEDGDEAACAFSSSSSSSGQELLAATAAHLDHFQRTFVRSHVQRAAFDRNSDTTAHPSGKSSSNTKKGSAMPMMPPLFDADAAARIIGRHFDRRALGPWGTAAASLSSSSSTRLVSCVDPYIACCGYALCTHPFARKLFPHLSGGGGNNSSSSGRSGTGVQWSDLTAPATDGTGALVDPTAAAMAGPAHPPSHRQQPPPRPTVSLPGMPRGYNNIINSVLRRETAKAAGSADSGSDSSSCTGTAAGERSGPNSTAVAVAMPSAFAAADALERFMLAQMLSLNARDIEAKAAALSSSAAGISTASGAAASQLMDTALVPFLPLALIFTGAWHLSHRQCVGFPYLQLAADPARRVSFLVPVNSGSDKRNSSENKIKISSSGRGGDALCVVPASDLGAATEGYGVDSWESRLRVAGWAVVARLLSPVPQQQQQQEKGNSESKVTGAATPRRCRTYVTDGTAPLAKL